MSEPTQEDLLESGLLKALNANGFSFQYAAIRKAVELYRESTSPFELEAVEYPVSIKGRTIHIDLILRHKHCPFYLVIECKRPDPAISNWCFVKAPYVSRKTHGGERIVREALKPDPELLKHSVHLQFLRGEENVYRISFELKSTAKGEGRPARGAINDAVTQALRGLNGLIELSSEWSETGRVLIQPVAPAYGSGRYAAFMPVVLTTATIWTSSTDISMADLESGNLTKDQIDLKKEPWIYFHYPQSPDLRHNLKVTGPRRTIDEVLYRDYTRTVCIVSTNGLADFLSHWESCDKWLDE